MTVKGDFLDPVVKYWGSIYKTKTCWIWKPCIGKPWRPFINVEGKRVYTSRWVWEYFNGTIPEGLKVCHTCDNPKCVRPDHLFVGTQRENLIDSINKGRWNSKDRGSLGESNTAAKIDKGVVLSLRARYVKGKNTKKLANEYGITTRQVLNIVQRKAWRHIK